jgi:hypothetical protein
LKRLVKDTLTTSPGTKKLADATFRKIELSYQKRYMRQFSFKVFLICGLTFISCDPCDNLDCIADNHSGQFRVTSKVDGKDLVFGPNAIYDKTKIKFFSLNGIDTIFFQYNHIKFSGIGYDSILHVRFYPELPAPAYMKLNDTDTDTLAITYNKFKTKCCGTITEITRFRYNNTIDIPGDQGTQEIRK